MEKEKEKVKDKEKDKEKEKPIFEVFISNKDNKEYLASKNINFNNFIIRFLKS